MINANYTWFKCEECGTINRILPGEKFDAIEDLAKILKCECVKEEAKPKKTRKKVVKDAA